MENQRRAGRPKTRPPTKVTNFRLQMPLYKRLKQETRRRRRTHPMAKPRATMLQIVEALLDTHLPALEVDK